MNDLLAREVVGNGRHFGLRRSIVGASDGVSPFDHALGRRVLGCQIEHPQIIRIARQIDLVRGHGPT